MKKFLIWCKEHPKLVASLLTSVGAIILALLTCSCGITRASVRNLAEGTTTEIKITTSNPTSVSASPNVELTPKSN